MHECRRIEYGVIMVQETCLRRSRSTEAELKLTLLRLLHLVREVDPVSATPAHTSPSWNMLRSSVHQTLNRNTLNSKYYYSKMTPRRPDRQLPPHTSHLMDCQFLCAPCIKTFINICCYNIFYEYCSMCGLSQVLIKT